MVILPRAAVHVERRPPSGSECPHRPGRTGVAPVRSPIVPGPTPIRRFTPGVEKGHRDGVGRPVRSWDKEVEGGQRDTAGKASDLERLCQLADDDNHVEHRCPRSKVRRPRPAGDQGRLAGAELSTKSRSGAMTGLQAKTMPLPFGKGLRPGCFGTRPATDRGGGSTQQPSKGV